MTVSTDTIPGSPAPARERWPALDVLRGLAVLGMVLAHWHKVLGAGGADTWAENPVGWGITLAVAEKDRAIFAVLFGAGLAIMIRGLEAAGRPVWRVCGRRLVVLYAFGLALEVATRFSILREYAWWGLALLLVRGASSRGLVFLALLSMAAPTLREAVDSGLAVRRDGVEQVREREEAQVQAWRAMQAAEAETLSRAGYREAVALRWEQVVRHAFSLGAFTPREYLGLFIFGLLAVRHGWWADPLRYQRVWMTGIVLGVGVWVTYWWWWSSLPLDAVTPRLAVRLRAGGGLIDEQYLAFSVIGVVVLVLARRPDWLRWGRPWAWVGRLALTHYVVQALVIDFLSAPYGFGLRVSPWGEVAGGLTLFGVMVIFSAWWLRRFQLGPLEWLWRSATYARWEPLRRRAPASATGGE